MKKLQILIDYRGAFYSSVKNNKWFCSYDVERLVRKIKEYDFFDLVEVVNFSEVDFSMNYEGVYVIYQSSEDYTQEYKSYIEDVIYALKLKGAILIPEYENFKAHHNKVMMEILRKLYLQDLKVNPNTKVYGTFEDMLNQIDKYSKYPYVIKQANGSGSLEVAIACNQKELLSCARKMSKSKDSLKIRLKERIKRIVRKGYIPYSKNRHKYIVQDFVKMDGDFKVLNFNGKMYVLYRNMRKNDFRASGSGNFTFDIPKKFCLDKLLDFADSICKKIPSPIHSLDIGFYNDNCYLIEFQTVMFGTYTIVNSEWYYTKDNGVWKKNNEKSILEDEYARSLVEFLKR